MTTLIDPPRIEPQRRAPTTPHAGRAVPLLVWLAVFAGVAAGILAGLHAAPMVLVEVLAGTSVVCLSSVAVIEAVTGHSGPLTLRRVDSRAPNGDVS